MKKILFILGLLIAPISSFAFATTSVPLIATTSTSVYINKINGSQPGLILLNSTTTNATSTNIGTTYINTLSSAGINIHSNNGTDVVLLGAGGGSNATFYGGVNINGSTRLATSLNGCLEATAGVISATGSACGSGGGSSFGQSWEIIGGVLQPTTTIAVSVPDTLTVTSNIVGKPGSNMDLSFYFAGSSSGFYGGTNDFIVTTNSSTRLQVNDSFVGFSVPIITTVGSVGAPSIYFNSNPLTGIYQSATDNVDFSINGTQALNISATGVTIPVGTLTVSALSDGCLSSISGVVTSSSCYSFANTDKWSTSSPDTRFIQPNSALGTIVTWSTTTSATSTNLYTSGQTILSAISGNVGIGTTTPTANLSVQGNQLISGTSTVGNLVATSTLTINSLATPAGSFLAVSPTGKVIATTTPSGSSAPTNLTDYPKAIFATDAGSGGLDLTSNTVMKLGMVRVSESITVNKISFVVYAATTPGALKIGLYKEDGQTLVFSTTTSSISTTGLKTYTLSSPVDVTAGNYYIAFLSQSTANIGILGYVTSGSNSMQILNKSVTSEPILEGSLTVTADTLPSTFTPSSITAVDSYTAVIRLDN